MFMQPVVRYGRCVAFRRAGTLSVSLESAPIRHTLCAPRWAVFGAGSAMRPVCIEYSTGETGRSHVTSFKYRTAALRFASITASSLPSSFSASAAVPASTAGAKKRCARRSDRDEPRGMNCSTLMFGGPGAEYTTVLGHSQK